MFASPFILSEFERTLGSKKIGFAPEQVRRAVAAIKEISVIVEPAITLHVIRAKDSDNRILECAVKAEAQVLITGDMRHIRPLGSIQGIPILTPREFLDKYFPGS